MGDIPYHLVYGRGDSLLLLLRGEEIFVGQYIDAGTNYINLIHCRQHNNPNKLSGEFSFHRNEIVNIYYLKSNKPQKVCNCKVPKKKTIEILVTEYYRLLTMTHNYVYVQRADNRYFKIMEKLNESENIGVFVTDVLRKAVIKVVAVSTCTEVFLFDLIEHKNRYFYPELKQIFESPYICKIIHQGGPLVDILQRSYKVYMQNVFDIEIVDALLQKSIDGESSKRFHSLSECLTAYLNLPSCFLNHALEVCAKSWQERPLPKNQLTGAAQLVTYLITLKKQMERLLLSDTYTAISMAHSLYCTLTMLHFGSETYTTDKAGEASKDNGVSNASQAKPFKPIEITDGFQANKVPDNIAAIIPALKDLEVAEEGDDEEEEDE